MSRIAEKNRNKRWNLIGLRREQETQKINQLFSEVGQCHFNLESLFSMRPSPVRKGT